MSVKNESVFVPGEGKTFRKLNNGMEPKEFSSLRIETSRPLRSAEARQLFALIDYAWITKVRGQELTERFPDSDTSMVVDADLGRSFSSKPWERFGEFAAEINDFIADGSTVRRDGTRKVEGLKDVTVTLWVPDN